MRIYLGVIWLFMLGCDENPKQYVDYLDGYWEIEAVTLNNGLHKTYKFNETVDYIKINDSLKGFRKKLKPGINDVYFTSDDAQALVIKVENDSLNLYYSTPYSSWKETVLEASPAHLRVSNENKDVYLYRRYIPIKLDIE